MQKSQSKLLLLLWFIALIAASPVATCQETEQESVQMTLDALDSLETATQKPADAFSLDLLDEATGSGDDASPVEEFTSQLWKDNLRLTIDSANRTVYSGRSGKAGGLGFVGIDLHKVFTDDRGDWGTLTLQPFWTRIDNLDFDPATFQGDSDIELEYRIFNFNYTRHGKGKTNFRIGHFEIPFGLEQIINTNGTLRDYTHIQNFGLKSDWGVTFNGQASGVEYEMGLSRGSGNEWRRRDDPYIVAGRIGTSRDEPVILGISAFQGKVLNFGPGDETVQRGRVGADFTFADEKLVWLAELSAGYEDDDRAYTSLLEIDWMNPLETVLAYNQTQLRGFGRSDGWDNEFRNSAGFRWTPTAHHAISCQLSHFFDTLASENRGTVFEFQLRYRL